MQRYNIFYQVHKGLRALLYETAIRLQQTDFWNVEESEDALEQLDLVIAVFEKHAYHEDKNIFPAVEKYDPAIADAFEQEHAKDHLLGQLLSESIALYKTSAVITEKAEAGKKTQAAFIKFMTFNLEHMAKEEDVLNKILWRHYTDDELKAITHKIIAEIPQDEAAQYNKWMMRGLNNAEIVTWMKTVEKTAPEPVFQSLFATAEKELSQKRFRLVLEGLTEGTMVA